MTILKKLDIYWSKANPSIKHKLHVYDAIIRSKLLDGLESAAMNTSVKHSLDIFQLKGLRKILKIKATFVDRAQDHRTIYNTVQTHIHNSTIVGKQEKQYKTYSEVYEERKTKLLNKIILEPEDSPIKQVIFQPGTLKPTNITHQPGVKRRVGKPKVKSVETGFERLWKLVGEKQNENLRYTIMNLDNEEHIRELTRAAKRNLSEFSPHHVIRT